MKEKIKLMLLSIAFIAFYFTPSYLPQTAEESSNALINAIYLLHDYSNKHVLTCLVPAFFIAGAISVYITKDSVVKLLGAESKKHVSYGIASVSGAILAVCSCTILPLFAGIRQRGAGLGPAVTFLFSGPAINIAAMFLTISVLGLHIGMARIISAVLLSLLIGLTMHAVFKEKTTKGVVYSWEEEKMKTPNKILILFFASMVLILIVNGLQINPGIKYILMLLSALATLYIAFNHLSRESTYRWLRETWRYTKMLLPVLFIGVFIAGFIMPFLPRDLVTGVVGSNTVSGNFVASIFGAFMYFSTLTEVPIIQALMDKGMSKGPALALLLAGPSLSLPNMLVIRKVLGSKKTIVYISLVVIYSTTAGLIYGAI